PPSGTVTKVMLVVALEFGILHQPVSIDPLAVAAGIDFPLLEELSERSRMTYRIVLLLIAHHQERPERRQRNDEQRRGQRAPPCAKISPAEQHQQRKHRSREEEEEDERKQKRRLLVRQHWVPKPGHWGEPNKQHRQQPDDCQRKLLPDHKHQEDVDARGPRPCLDAAQRRPIESFVYLTPQRGEVFIGAFQFDITQFSPQTSELDGSGESCERVKHS